MGNLGVARAAATLAAMLVAPGALAIGNATVDVRGPDLLVAGDSATYSGNYRVDGVGITRGEVRVTLDGQPAWTGLTNAFGLWQATLAFPAGGVHRVHVDVAGPAGLAGLDASADLDVRAAVPPGPPAALLIEPTGVADEFRLAWAPPLDDGLAPVDSYRVSRRTLPSAGFAPLATTAGLAAADRVAFEGAYVYRVAATNLAGEGPPADLAFLAPPAPEANGTTVAVESVEACDGYQFSFCRSAASGGLVELLGGGPVRVRLRLVGDVTLDGAPVAGVRPHFQIEGRFPTSCSTSGCGPAQTIESATAEGVTGADGRYTVPHTGALPWSGVGVGQCATTSYSVAGGYDAGSGSASATLRICRN